MIFKPNKRIMSSTHLAILAVDAYVINNNELYEIGQKYKSNPFNHVHPYTINLKEYNDQAKNTIISSEYYLQFHGQILEENPMEYVLFDCSTLDDLLSEEISNARIEDLFENIDFKKILSHFPIQPYKDKFRRLDAPFYLIVELTYMKSYDHYSGGYEYDLFADIVGYLDGNLDKQLFDVLKIGE